jgi:hypothetical protein
MLIQHVERRLFQGPNAVDTGHLAQVVREGLLVQHTTGTVSAIEFLKANAVHSIVIQRVLSGSAVRGDDIQALLDQPVSFDA